MAEGPGRVASNDNCVAVHMADRYNDPVVLTPAEAREFAGRVLAAADRAVPAGGVSPVPDAHASARAEGYEAAALLVDQAVSDARWSNPDTERAVTAFGQAIAAAIRISAGIARRREPVEPVSDTPEIPDEVLLEAYRRAVRGHPRTVSSHGLRAVVAAARPYLVAAAPSVPLEALKALFAFWDCWHNEVGLCDPDGQPGVASLLMIDDAHRLDELGDAIEPFEDQLRAGLFPGTGTPPARCEIEGAHGCHNNGPGPFCPGLSAKDARLLAAAGASQETPKEQHHDRP